MKEGEVLVVFGESLPQTWLDRVPNCRIVISPRSLKMQIEAANRQWININELSGTGNIYEAHALLKELSDVRLLDGTKVSKSVEYRGFEVWWMHYNDLFLYFCLPFTQYKDLLVHLMQYDKIYLYRPTYKSLFLCYLRAQSKDVAIFDDQRTGQSLFPPFGILLQIVITFLSVIFLSIKPRPIALYTGDKFKMGADYDYRMQFIYEELRNRKVSFVEFIRSLESWKTVLDHALSRRRPVIYSEAILFIAKLMGVVSGSQRRARRAYDREITLTTADNDRFKSLLSVQYLIAASTDVWAIRCMSFILGMIRVRSMITSSASRSFSTILACKIRGIPTVGILHGVASRHYNVNDFMTGFDGVRPLSVDHYGLWSEWWKKYYLQNSRAYRPNQLFVSGPMRPWLREAASLNVRSPHEPVSVLFVSEQLAPPEETLPYLQALLDTSGINVYMTFRPYRDGFEEWLKRNSPDILGRIGEERIIRSGIHDAIEHADVVVGAHSTGVLESLLQLKVPIYFRTQKWGDYYELAAGGDSPFFAETTEELIRKIKKADAVPVEERRRLQERYFGDPQKNGSAWVVERAMQLLQQ